MMETNELPYKILIFPSNWCDAIHKKYNKNYIFMKKIFAEFNQKVNL